MVSIGGNVQWGSVCDSGDTVAITPGSTTYDWTATAPFTGRWIFLETWFNVLGVQVASWVNDERGTDGLSWERSGTIPAGAFTLCVRVWWGYGNSTPGTWSGTVTFSGAALPCAGGTERKDLTTDLVILGGTSVDAIAIFLGGLWLQLLALMVDVIGVHVMSTQTLCASLPPPMPVITTADYLALTGVSGAPTTDQIAKFWQAVQAAVWPYFCQCTAGTGGVAPPAPTAPSITIVQPPSIVCDGTDLCSFLNHLAQKIDNVSLQLQYTRRDVSLIQTQGVPFAYLEGLLHAGLSGSGEFFVEDILALAVQITTFPLDVPETSDSPGTVYSAGFITLGTRHGWMRGHRVTRNPFFLTPIQGDVTRVAYSFHTGVVANIQEFVREPGA